MRRDVRLVENSGEPKMTQETPVPRLDLAPKLKRPLSLWNPLDYLRLLYWVFYFPQALRWYIDKFGRGNIARNLLLQGLALIVVIPLFLSVIIQTIGVSIDWVGVAFGLAFGPALSLALSLILDSAFGVGLGVAFGVAFGMAFGVNFGVAFWVAFCLVGAVASVANSKTSDDMAQGVKSVLLIVISVGLGLGIVTLGLTLMVGLGIVPLGVAAVALGVTAVFLGAAVSVVLGVAELGLGVIFSVALGLAVSVGLGLAGMGLDLVESALGNAFGLALGLAGMILASLGLVGMAFGVAILRPESWLIGLFFNIRYLQKGSLFFLRITSIPLPYLSIQLTKWLQQNWETGLYNANQLLAYTLQFIPVVKAVNQVLNKLPSEQVIYRIAQLVEKPFHWNLVRLISFDLNETLNFEAIGGISLPPSWKHDLNEKLNFEAIGGISLPPSCEQWLQNRFPTKTFLDTPAPRAAAAGFWYLHENKPAKAEEAFAVVRSLLYGEEMYALAKTLTVFHKAENVDDISRLSLKTFNVTSLQSSQETLLRPRTWEAIYSLDRVVEDIQLVQRSVSRGTRAFALNRAQGELTNILNNPEILPQAERGLIIDIAETWQKALLEIAGEVGEISITKPVLNPYIIGDPVIGDRFMGREDVMRQLEELWVMGQQLQSVVIYGHRRMGKTSILRNAVNSVGSGIKVAYVNMLNAGNISKGVGEVLMAICDAVLEVVNLPPPDDDKLLQIPYRTFERYFKQIVETLNATSVRGLIIALDEFEKIEELIKAGEIPQDFMGYLRGLVQMNSQVAFAFAGLHTLEEMTADYFQPFFASVIPIHVGFMEPAASKQILANPVQLLDVEMRHQSSDVETYHGRSLQEDFPLDYTTEALDKIYDLTHGQPYLVQLIGFQLVRRYNDQVFEMGRKRDLIFAVEEVEAVVNDPQFFQQGRYYFDGVWSQAAQGAPGQQIILKILAPHPEGLNCRDITCRDVPWCASTDDIGLEKALKTLKRHDVIQETEGRWYIIVELFRRWVLQLQTK